MRSCGLYVIIMIKVSLINLMTVEQRNGTNFSAVSPLDRSTEGGLWHCCCYVSATTSRLKLGSWYKHDDEEDGYDDKNKWNIDVYNPRRPPAMVTSWDFSTRQVLPTGDLSSPSLWRPLNFGLRLFWFVITIVPIIWPFLAQGHHYHNWLY